MGTPSLACISSSNPSSAMSNNIYFLQNHNHHRTTDKWKWIQVWQRAVGKHPSYLWDWKVKIQIVCLRSSVVFFPFSFYLHYCTSIVGITPVLVANAKITNILKMSLWVERSAVNGESVAIFLFLCLWTELVIVWLQGNKSCIFPCILPQIQFWGGCLRSQTRNFLV